MEKVGKVENNIFVEILKAIQIMPQQYTFLHRVYTFFWTVEEKIGSKSYERKKNKINQGKGTV